MAYEMRISDWSSDVCSSDLIVRKKEAIAARLASADDRDGRFGVTFDAALHEQPVRRAFEVEQSGRKAGRTTKQQADAERFKVLGKAVAPCEGMPANPRPLPFGYGLAIAACRVGRVGTIFERLAERRSEENTSELPSIMRISYAAFCLKTNN